MGPRRHGKTMKNRKDDVDFSSIGSLPVTILHDDGDADDDVIKTPTKTTTTTDQLTANDVLLGRGKGANRRIGNVLYRVLVSRATRQAGTNYQTMTGATKRELAKNVVATVKRRGGRFMKVVGALKPERGHEHDDGSATKITRYVEVSDAVAIDKVKQGFRHQFKTCPLKEPGMMRTCGDNGQLDPVTDFTISSKHESWPRGESGTIGAPMFHERQAFWHHHDAKQQQSGGHQVREQYSLQPSSNRNDDRCTFVGRSYQNTQGMSPTNSLSVLPTNIEGSFSPKTERLDRLFPCLPGSLLFPPNHPWYAPLLLKVATPTLSPQLRGETSSLLQYPSLSLLSCSSLPGGGMHVGTTLTRRNTGLWRS